MRISRGSAAEGGRSVRDWISSYLVAPRPLGVKGLQPLKLNPQTKTCRAQCAMKARPSSREALPCPRSGFSKAREDEPMAAHSACRIMAAQRVRVRAGEKSFPAVFPPGSRDTKTQPEGGAKRRLSMSNPKDCHAVPSARGEREMGESCRGGGTGFSVHILRSRRAEQ